MFGFTFEHMKYKAPAGQRDHRTTNAGKCYNDESNKATREEYATNSLTTSAYTHRAKAPAGFKRDNM